MTARILAVLMAAALLVLPASSAASASPTPIAGPLGTPCPGWQVVPSPNDGSLPTELNDVSTLASNDAWAVGDSGAIGVNQRRAPVAMHWDGSTWTMSPQPAIARRNGAQLNGVVAIGSADVWAVGTRNIRTSAGPIDPLAEHWDGTGWTAVPTPSPGVRAELEAVDGVATDDVWAVGYWTSHPQGQQVPLTLHWDGLTWTAFPTLDPHGANAYVQDVVAIGPNDVWAAGVVGNLANRKPLTLHWDGTAWSSIHGEIVGEGLLFGISASGPGHVWAVGFRYANSGQGVTYAQHWNGTAWSHVRTPNPVHSFSSLEDVTSIDPANAWAVGGGGRGVGPPIEVFDHWDGTRWHQTPASHGPLDGDFLRAIDAGPGGIMWSVGSSRQTTGTDVVTLTERYCP